MTPAQLEAMKAGRERARRQRDRDAKRRVREFQQWLVSGRKHGIPQVPSDADYRIARSR